ncbi:ABC transporter ATP-binding protein [Candidatus Bathyarchaeota archaeon]|nr:ABC transporter ATP-binding protein [Candidatus Bathyarchaeota archaeon]
MEEKSKNNGKNQKGKKDTLANIRRVLGYVLPHWQFKVVIFLMMITVILDVLTPDILGDTIDMIGNIAEGGGTGESHSAASFILIPVSNWLVSAFNWDPSYTRLGVFCFSIVFIAASTGLLNYAGRYATAWITQKSSFEIRKDMYNSLLEQSFSFYDQQRTGQLMARATSDVSMIERFFGMGLRTLFSTGLLLILILWRLIQLSTTLTMVTVFTLPFIYVIMREFNKRSRPMWQIIRDQFGDITSVFQENLMGLRVVRGFAQEVQEETKLNNELNKYFNSGITLGKWRAFYLPLATLITGTGIAIILWIGGNLVMSGALTIGGLTAFYYYSNRLSMPIRQLGQISDTLLRVTAASDRVFEIVDSEVAVKDKPDAVNLVNPQGHVQFQDVSFGYDGKNMVLRDIKLDIKPGTTIAILGATGSGKSSIINLIPRFYDVNKGSIKIDGKDVRDYKIKSLREHVGIVRQDPFIFSTNFKENIAYGVDNPKMNDIETAAKRAKIHDYIISTSKGYDTPIGERGVTVSGGQKQRIAIARALLKNPKILILDDSTSSVDTQTEHEIQQALDELLTNRTTFIITQRLSSIKKADYIIVLDNGEIAEEGTHEKLIEQKGIYYKLYETQVSGGERRGED